jgi:hypothetical protein
MQITFSSLVELQEYQRSHPLPDTMPMPEPAPPTQDCPDCLPPLTADLEGELRRAINAAARDDASGTPDYILAHYLMRALSSAEDLVNARDNWHGRSDWHGSTGELAKLYSQLIMAVVRKFPGESRHQTALRYIQQAEAAATSGGEVNAVEHHQTKGTYKRGTPD